MEGGQDKFYAAVFGIYLFYDLFLLGRGEGGYAPRSSTGSFSQSVKSVSQIHYELV